MSQKRVSTAETLIIWGNLNNNDIIIIHNIFSWRVGLRGIREVEGMSNKGTIKINGDRDTITLYLGYCQKWHEVLRKTNHLMTGKGIGAGFGNAGKLNNEAE